MRTWPEQRATGKPGRLLVRSVGDVAFGARAAGDDAGEQLVSGLDRVVHRG